MVHEHLRRALGDMQGPRDARSAGVTEVQANLGELRGSRESGHRCEGQRFQAHVPHRSCRHCDRCRCGGIRVASSSVGLAVDVTVVVTVSVAVAAGVTVDATDIVAVAVGVTVVATVRAGRSVGVSTTVGLTVAVGVTVTLGITVGITVGATDRAGASVRVRLARSALIDVSVSPSINLSNNVSTSTSSTVDASGVNLGPPQNRCFLPARARDRGRRYQPTLFRQGGRDGGGGGVRGDAGVLPRFGREDRVVVVAARATGKPWYRGLERRGRGAYECVALIV